MKVYHYPQVDFDQINRTLRETGKKLRIDIGTSISAPVSKFWFERMQDIVVIGIEPNPDCVYEETLWYNKLLSIQGVFKDDPQRDFYFHVIGACDDIENVEESDFFVTSKNVGCSSLLKPIGIQVEKVIKVQKFPMHHLLRHLEFDSIELIKIDAQGKDLDIVKSMGDFISKVCFIDLEDNCERSYVGAPTKKAILDYMSSKGFHLYESSGGNSRFKNTSREFPENFKNTSGEM